MELLTLASSFLLALSFLLQHCASDQLNLPNSLQQVDHAKITQLSVSLPRKLINLHQETDMTSPFQDFMPTKKLLEPSKDRKQHEREENAAERGEEEEGVNKSEYFIMDYGWVRRRRPIHNKQIPFVP